MAVEETPLGPSPENTIGTLSRTTISRELGQLLSKARQLSHLRTYVSPSNYAENFFSHKTLNGGIQASPVVQITGRLLPPPPFRDSMILGLQYNYQRRYSKIPYQGSRTLPSIKNKLKTRNPVRNITPPPQTDFNILYVWQRPRTTGPPQGLRVTVSTPLARSL